MIEWCLIISCNYVNPIVEVTHWWHICHHIVLYTISWLMFTGPATLLIVFFPLCLTYLCFLMWINKFSTPQCCSSPWLCCPQACPNNMGADTCWNYFCTSASPVSYPQSQDKLLVLVEANTWHPWHGQSHLIQLVGLHCWSKKTHSCWAKRWGWFLCASQVCVCVRQRSVCSQDHQSWN